MLKRLKLFFAAAFLAGSLSVARAQTPLVTGNIGGGGADNFADTVGYSFTVGASNIHVTQLGVLDLNSIGLEFANTVGLWTNSGTLLGVATFAAGSDGVTLENGFQWSNVTPFDLISGQTYRIGAFSAGLERRVSLAGASGGNLSSGFFMNNAVTLVGSVRSNDFNDFAFPGQAPFANESVIGPNFRFTAIPEPSTYAAVAGIAALGLVALRRRSR